MLTCCIHSLIFSSALMMTDYVGTWKKMVNSLLNPTINFWRVTEQSINMISLLKLSGSLVTPHQRISFYAWEAVKERTLTIDNLMRKDLTTANRCFLCKCCSESCNHLLLWCPVSYKLWSMVFGLLGISWAVSGSVKTELLAWEGMCNRNKNCRLLSLTIIWVGLFGKRRTIVLWRVKRLILPLSRINDFTFLVLLFQGTTLIIWMTYVIL